MALSFKHSKSLGYRITIWFDEMKKYHANYTKQFNELFTNCLSRVYSISNDIQRTINKDPKSVLRDKYNDIVSLLDFHSTNFYELKELLRGYLDHFETINNFDVDYQSIEPIKTVIDYEYNIITEFQVLSRNIVKSGALIYKRKQSAKKKVEGFSLHIRNYLRFTREFNKEKPLRDESTANTISELTDEIRITQERELAREIQDIIEEITEE
ncbi:MAG: hypothetical protein FK733_13575 [Asgard group archaeon]|nr:hypothetical protein [Asgard group archaeon]